MSVQTPIIIGVAGGSGSGKTTVSKEILRHIGAEHLAYLQHDAYYRDLSHLPMAERQAVNFDHPDSLENELLIEHLRTLQQGRPVQVPVYDFANYVRTDQLRQVEPKRVILVEGILIFVDKTLRDMMDIKIYVDTPADLCFIRRLKRDVLERQRTVDHVIEQYLGTVRPMHLDFVEPSKRYADVIIPHGGHNTKAIEMVVAQIQRMLTPSPRPRRWRHLTPLLLFLFLIFGLGDAAVPPQHALLVEVDQISHNYQFSFLDWESRTIADELARRWNPPTMPTTDSEQRQMVETFLEQIRQVHRLEESLDKLPAKNTVHKTRLSPQKLFLSRPLTAAKNEQARLQTQVETILARQVETILQAEGFTLAGHVFPPVAFRLIEPPTALILSPRDRIENQHFIGLQPGLSNEQREKIEQALDRRGDVSSYITDIGGLGSYPTMVVNHPDLLYLLDVIAHEWTHNYLFTFPSNIAWGYQSAPRLMTLNETAASLVGSEISRKVIARFYPDLAAQLPPLDQTGQASPAKPSEFALTMRQIRQEVDRLLAAGQIDTAESYMEAERVKLVKKGYNLRKLNQAYFAFHGSYALSPGSVDPIGPQIRQLRTNSPSLKTFLDRVGWLNSYEDYLTWVKEIQPKLHHSQE